MDRMTGYEPVDSGSNPALPIIFYSVLKDIGLEENSDIISM